jgi:C4-dicarboxylate-specific signal transduction histidine kinase
VDGRPSLRIDYRWAAGEITDRIRALVKKGTSQNEPLDSNALIREIVALTRGETVKHGISIETQLADGLPPIEGDRIQLQQVILNLIINAIEAMSGTGEGLRELRISTAKAEADLVLVTVQDSGPGLAPVNLERLFEPFYTTKLDGQGMGLSICRSIIEAHRGPAVGGCERALRRRI